MRLSGGLKLELLPLFSLFFAPVFSELRNITVDDQFGDSVTGLVPEYLPDGVWNVGSPTENCEPCHVKPGIVDLDQIYNKTWHDATPLNSPTPTTITVRFTGSAVYVFNIIPNMLPNETITLVNITFSIDGISPSTFIHQPDPNTSTILYNQLVYKNTALDYGPHTLTMTGGHYAILLFDYLTYTTQTNDSDTGTLAATGSGATSTSTNAGQSSSHSNTPTSDLSSSSGSTPIGAIAGATVGGVILLFGVALGAFLWGRRRTRSNPPVHPRQGYARADGGPGTTLLSTAHPVTPWLYGADASDTSGEVPQRPSPVAVHVEGASNTRCTSKSRRELARRLETLQRTRTVLSSQATTGNPPTELVGDGGTVVAMRELETEISQLRNVLATWNAMRLADRGHDGHLEPLPQYAE